MLRESPIISKQDYGAYGRDAVFDVNATFDITDDFVSDLKAGKLTLRFKGNAAYDDVFDERHILSFNFRAKIFAGGKALIIPEAEPENTNQ